MKIECRVCGSSSQKLVYSGGTDYSLTSIMGKTNSRLSLYICDTCGHIQNGNEFVKRINEYYENEYDLLMDSVESDELFCDFNGQSITKTARNFRPFAQIMEQMPPCKFMDLGSGKGVMVKVIKEEFPDWDISAFEMSERYRPYLSKILISKNIYLGGSEQLAELNGQFDLVTLFDVLEHVDDPIQILNSAYDILKAGGYLYVQVPAIYDGELDWLIVDHLSHFSLEMIQNTVNRAGFKICSASDSASYGSLQILCQKTKDGERNSVASNRINVHDYSHEIISRHNNYWDKLCKVAEKGVEIATRTGRPIGIFGTGTAASALVVYVEKVQGLVNCFIDENKYRIGKTHFGRSIVDAKNVPDISCVLLGVAQRNLKYIRPKLKHLEVPVLGTDEP